MKLALTFLASAASALNLDAVASTQSFSYLKEQPATLIIANAYCNTAGGAYNVYRISMTPGQTVDTCNDLCLNTQGCKRFLFGRQGGYNNRCDLINIDDCEIIPGHYNFDYYQPTQNNQVRLHSSHKSAADPNGCNSKVHPQGYLGVRPYGTQ